jgi:hypothetical protein
VAEALLDIRPGTLPPGVCYTSEQTRLVAFAENMQAVLESGMAFYNYGASVPAPEFQDYPWFRTVDGLWYTYSGDWISQRPKKDQDPNTRILYVGTLVALQTYDGGDTNPPSDRSGPMWEEDTTFRGRSPIGVGAIPDSDPPVTLALLQEHGAGSHEQTVAQLPAHTHPPIDADVDGFWMHRTTSVGGNGNVGASPDSQRVSTTGATGGGEEFPIVHPVLACYVAKPTARLYYKV